jgi:hypothetical protein
LKADVIKALDARVIEGGLTLREPFTSYIVELWNDPRVQEAYARRSEYQLSDSAK